MVKQYPYTFWTFQVPDGESTTDANGYVDAEPGAYVEVGPCRDQMNAGGKTAALTDSKPVLFAALIHLPLTTPDIAIGTDIEVRDGDLLRRRGKVIGFNRGLLHCRIWV